jgi:hypothetical protein
MRKSRKKGSCCGFKQPQRGGFVRTSYVGNYPDGETGFSWLETEKITGRDQLSYNVSSLPKAFLNGGKKKKTRTKKRSNISQKRKIKNLRKSVKKTRQLNYRRR